MQIRSRMSMSADGYVTTPDGWPALTADPAFESGKSHGIRMAIQCDRSQTDATVPSIQDLIPLHKFQTNFIERVVTLAVWPPQFGIRNFKLEI